MNRYSKWALCVTVCVISAASLSHKSRVVPDQNSAKASPQPAAAMVSPNILSPNIVSSNIGVAKSQPAAKLHVSARSASAPPQVHSSFGRTPLSFEENHGQTDARVKYLARGRGYTLFLAPEEAVLALRYRSEESSQKHSGQPGMPSNNDAAKWSQANLRLSLEGANTSSRVTGVDQQRGISNYFIGSDPSQWHTQIPNYAKVLYQDVYPGIDVAYYGNEGQLETDYILAPEAEAREIKLGVQGAASLRVNEGGELLLQIDGGEVRLKKPFAYQLVNGTRREVSVAYELLAKNEAGFALGAYDHSQKLIIDPALFFSTYLGGTGQDIAHAVAADGVGDTFVTGQTTSTNFPTSTGVVQGSLGTSGTQNAFVTEYAPDGQSFIFSTYLGGNGTDSGNAIAINSVGQVYVAGQTTSSAFPLQHPLTGQGSLLGGMAAFVSQISANGATLLFSTYLTGNIFDEAAGVALDSAENIYVAGGTSSSNFPVVNAFQAAPGGAEDGFIAKLAAPNPTSNPGSTLLYSSYIGGLGFDQATSIAVDSTGNAFIAGLTNSANFPTVAPFQASLGGGGAALQNAWVAEVKQTNNVPTLFFSTYLGGSQFDQANGIAVDTSGDVYVTGFSQSPDFPLHNALQTFGGGQDAFVTEFAPGGGTLVFSTYFGGGGSGFGFTFGNAIALDSQKNIYFTGSTSSVDYPTLAPLVATLGDFFGNAVITELSSGGSFIQFSSYLGGSDHVPSSGFPTDTGNGIAVDGSGNIYVAGATGTLDFSTVNPHQAVLASQSSNAFVARIGTGSANMLSPAALDLGTSVVGVAAATQRISFEQATAPSATVSIALSGTNPGDFAEFDTCGPTLPNSVVCEITITFTPQATGTRTAVGNITSSAGNRTFNLSGTGVNSTPPGTLTFTSNLTNFGSVEIGFQSAPQTINVQNTGATPVALTSISTSGTNPGDFFGFLQTGGNCPNFDVVPAGVTCQISVIFAPQPGAAGPRGPATLVVSGNFTTSPAQISPLNGTATAIIASLNPTFLNFPGTVIGTTSAPLTVTLTNNSTTQSLTSIQVQALTGTFALATNTCTATLAPSSSCTFSLTFTPGAAGFFSGSIQVTDSDPAPQSVSLFGLGLDAQATLQLPIPTQFPFGRTTVGSQVTKFLNLFNIGNTNLIFTTPVSGTNPGDFTASSSSNCNGTIAAGTSCTLTLTFTPTATGPRFATVTLAGSFTNNGVVLNLSGTGDAATSVDFLPSPLIFPVTAVGSQSADELAILSNIGITADRLSQASIGGANFNDFQIDFGFSGGPFESNCLFTTVLNAQATCFIPVRFTPTATGLRTATLSIPDTATGNPHSITLQGGQASGAPVVSFNVNPAAFGNQNLSTTSATLQVTLTNTGTATLNLTNVSALGGTDPGDFAVLNTTTCTTGAVVLASGSCVLELTFTPTALGARSATITFTDNAADSPETLTLTGTGTTASGGLTISPSSLPAGALGAAYGQTLTVTGGTPPFTFSISAGSLPAGLNLGTTSGSIGGVPTGTTSTFTVKVVDSSSPTPLTGSATYTITINAADTTNNAELNGHYAFLFSGFKDNGGTMEVVAASFTADGNGHITNGIEDNDNAAGAQPSQSFTGTYTLGADNRGTMALTTQSGTVVLAFSVGGIQNGIATKARFIRFDDLSGTNGHTGSGVIFAQDPAAFTVGSIKGNYALGDSGSNTSNGNPQSGVGFITADGNGNFTTGLIDLNGGGSLVSSAAISGTYAATANSASNGRFTTSTTIAGVPGTFVDSLYVISASQVIFISANATGNAVLSGTAQLQVPPAGGFGLSSISGNSVFAVEGKQSGGMSNVHIGVLSADGNGNFTASFDGNDSGTTDSGTASGTYTVASNGRCVFTFTTVSSGTIKPAIVYLDRVNQGFVGFTDGSASFGSLELGGSGFSNATLNTAFFIGTIAPADNQIGNTSGTGSFDGIGTVQATSDESDPGGILVGDKTTSQPYAVASNGRFTITGQSNTTIGYVASGCSFKTISSNGSNPGIVVGDCQVTPTAPIVSLNPNPAVFANQNVGTTSSTLQVTLSNIGNATLTFTNVSAPGGANPGDFAVLNSSTCTTDSGVNASSSCVLNLTFTPGAAGARSAIITFADNASDSPQTLTLQGTGIAVGANITITPSTTVNFGNQLINTTSGTVTTTVTNTGNQAIVLTSVTLNPAPNTLAGTNADGFTIVAGAGTCVNGTNLAASGGSCVLPVTFGPPAPGAVSSTITLNDSLGNQVITLNGTGIAPTISLNPASLNFSTAPATTSAAQTVTVTNSGAAPLHINSVLLGGESPDDFAFVNGATPCTKGTVVQPQAACTIGVDFTAPSQATFTATVTVTSDASNGTQVIPLTGTGVVISISPPPGGTTTVTVDPGGKAVFPLVLSSTGLTGSATLTCTSPQPTITCEVIPGTLPLTPNGVTHAAIVVNSFCSRLSPPASAPRSAPPAAPWLIALAGFALLASMALTKKRSLRLAMPLAVLLLAGIFASSCGNPPKGAAGATPPGTYTLVVKATVGQASSSISLTLIVN